MHKLSSKNTREDSAAAAAAAAKSLQSCPTLCDPIDGIPLGPSVPGILQARTLDWVAISFSNAWKWKVKEKSLSHAQLLATPWTRSLPGSYIHGIFQARVLEWGAIAFSKRRFYTWSIPNSNWLYSLQQKMEKLYTVSKNKTGSWLWLRSGAPCCKIQT